MDFPVSLYCSDNDGFELAYFTNGKVVVLNS